MISLRIKSVEGYQTCCQCVLQVNGVGDCMRMCACRVAERKQQNMMNVDNIAMVFAPTLLRSPEGTDPISSLTAIKFERELIECMIINYRRLFE